MVEPLTQTGRSAASFQLNQPITKGRKISNITIETTTPVGDVFVKFDHYDDEGGLLAHFDKGFFSNTGSWSRPFSWHGEHTILQNGFIRASILNQSGIDIYCTMKVSPQDD